MPIKFLFFILFTIWCYGAVGSIMTPPGDSAVGMDSTDLPSRTFKEIDSIIFKTDTLPYSVDTIYQGDSEKIIIRCTGITKYRGLTFYYKMWYFLHPKGSTIFSARHKRSTLTTWTFSVNGETGEVLSHSSKKWKSKKSRAKF